MKAIIVDPDSVARWVGEEPYDVQMSSNRAQISADVWWEACVRAVRAAPADLRAGVRAIGLSGQMHGVVLVDDAGESLGDAILWPDRRATDQLGIFEAIERANPGLLGNPIVPGMPGPLLAWLQSHEPALVAEARAVVSPKDWLRSRITGEQPIVTDASDASATLLYDVPADGWSQHAVDALRLDASLLPVIVRSGTTAGAVSQSAAAQLGLDPGLPVAAGAGDAAAALLGLGVEAPGRVLLNVGTGAQVIAVVDRPEPRFASLDLHQFRTASEVADWYVMAPIINAGLALSWVGQVLALEWDELYGHADSALECYSADPCFMPFLAGERDPRVGLDARAAWVGLSSEHDRASLARASLVGVASYLALRTRAVLELVGADRVELSGGAVRNRGWTQLLATLIDVDIDLAPDTHASARGAAVTAAHAQGEALAAPASTGSTAPQPALRVVADEALADLEERLLLA